MPARPDAEPGKAPASGAGPAAHAHLAHVVRVALETPQHAGLDSVLDYLSPAEVPPGTLVRAPLGARTVTGIVWGPGAAPAPEGGQAPAAPAYALKPLAERLDALPPLPAAWRELVGFAAGYYQRAVGELALGVLPPELRRLDGVQLGRRLARLRKAAEGRGPGQESAGQTAEDAPADAAAVADADAVAGAPAPEAVASPPVLTAEQAAALAAWQADPLRPALLHGATGSGKTEVYLRAAGQALQAGLQVLMLVPEINLTPQLERRLRERFPGRVLVSQHSALTPAQRLRAWLLAHLGLADIVLGTRLAVFTPLPRPGLVIVDEEHDPSFKQQEGARYSARDLAVVRARLEGVPVVLGSATPSLEAWQRCLQGRWRKLSMPARVGGGAMPAVHVLDMSRLPRPAAGTSAPALAPALLQAIEARMACGEQSLLLLNRRGYAPVLHCGACAWKSQCPHCSAWRVFHKADRTLRCHHCGLSERVPRACPECGNLDLAPVGRGTEKLEEQLGALLPGARVARIDADSTRLQGTLDAQLAAVHAGEVDVLVGTQMVTKGHDFRRITLVAAVNPDGALFSSDFRAPERLFALLLQAAGRAGRDARAAAHSEMWVQTWHPAHPVFEALRRHDFEAFAAAQLAEREASGLPPFSHLALLRAEARTAQAATAFLQDASRAAAQLPEAAHVSVYEPVPAAIARVADVERVQMLVESASRVALQRLLAGWVPALHALRGAHRGLQRWAVDVDPQSI